MRESDLLRLSTVHSAFTRELAPFVAIARAVKFKGNNTQHYIMKTTQAHARLCSRWAAQVCALLFPPTGISSVVILGVIARNKYFALPSDEQIALCEFVCARWKADVPQDWQLIMREAARGSCRDFCIYIRKRWKCASYKRALSAAARAGNIDICRLAFGWVCDAEGDGSLDLIWMLYECAAKGYIDVCELAIEFFATARTKGMRVEPIRWDWIIGIAVHGCERRISLDREHEMKMQEHADDICDCIVALAIRQGHTLFDWDFIRECFDGDASLMFYRLKKRADDAVRAQSESLARYVRASQML
jgi:hypothetical protein